MTKDSKITDRKQYLERDLTINDRRLRLADGEQSNSREIQLLFESMADKIDMLAEQIDRQFDWVEARCDRLEARCDRLESYCRELNRQLDLAISQQPDRVDNLND